jgi:hypothetical protein
MGYRIRVLGTSDALISLEDIKLAALPAVIEGEGGDGWETLVLKHAQGDAIAFIEKNPVVAGELGAEEIKEFEEEVVAYKPDSAAAWLRDYFTKVKVIYAFQLLSGTEIYDGFSRLHAVYGAIWNVGGGILQADGEGFSNEDGCTILWQFSDEVEGKWNCGVLVADGKWKNFVMDLSSESQREAFWRGELPAGVEMFVRKAN